MCVQRYGPSLTEFSSSSITHLFSADFKASQLPAARSFTSASAPLPALAVTRIKAGFSTYSLWAFALALALAVRLASASAAPHSKDDVGTARPRIPSSSGPWTSKVFSNSA